MWDGAWEWEWECALTGVAALVREVAGMEMSEVMCANIPIPIPMPRATFPGSRDWR